VRHWRFKTNKLDTKWREWQRKTSLILLFMRRAEGGETGRFLRCFREARADAEQPRMTRAGIGGTAGAPGTHAEKWHRSLSGISPYAGSQNPIRKATSPTRANGKAPTEKRLQTPQATVAATKAKQKQIQQQPQKLPD